MLANIVDLRGGGQVSQDNKTIMFFMYNGDNLTDPIFQYRHGDQ